jgi:predicted dehydrogenase
MQILAIAIAGCGSRGRTYASLAAKMPDRFRLVAGADPVAARVEATRNLTEGEFRGFASAEELLLQPKLADVLVISTQDIQHYLHCKIALDKGYDILLEKPISPDPMHVEDLLNRAQRLGRRIVVCHVLRYTPFYSKVKEILSSGVLGRVVSMNLQEGVGPYHQAHSFVRGKWSKSQDSSPMILAKCCHDMDIIAWLADSPCRSVASHGQLSFFRAENRPAGAPARCTDGCPHAATCLYDAHRYLGDRRSWLGMVHERAKELSDDEIVDFLKTSPWGRCVWACDNDVVDHQTLSLGFASGLSATFTMTAFDDGRHLEIYGTEGVLRGGHFYKKNLDCDLVLQKHEKAIEKITVQEPEGGYSGHGGGDYGLMSALHREMTCPPEEMLTSIAVSIESHRIAFAAEASRTKSRMIHL